MQSYQTKPRPIAAILPIAAPEMQSDYAPQNKPQSKAWIDAVLNRLLVIFPQWRLTNDAFLGLSAEWGRTFGNWRVTDEEIDCAIELCKAEWSRVPDNVTKAFREMLDKAIAKLRPARQPMLAIEVSPMQEIFDARAKCIGQIKKKHFPEQKWGMQIALECGEILDSLIITARQGSPDANGLEILRIVWGMV